LNAHLCQRFVNGGLTEAIANLVMIQRDWILGANQHHFVKLGSPEGDIGKGVVSQK
jgi:hypothetical protein